MAVAGPCEVATLAWRLAGQDRAWLAYGGRAGVVGAVALEGSSLTVAARCELGGAVGSEATLCLAWSGVTELGLYHGGNGQTLWRSSVDCPQVNGGDPASTSAVEANPQNDGAVVELPSALAVEMAAATTPAEAALALERALAANGGVPTPTMLALAPMAGYDCWQAMCRHHAAVLVDSGDFDTGVAFFVAGGSLTGAINALKAANRGDDAALLAAAHFAAP